MEFTPEVKDIILNYLKDGQREMAISYISRKFHTSHYDSRMLLEAFESKFSAELKSAIPKKFDSATCSGCLSRILKFIAILVAILAIGIFGLGYFFIELFGGEWNNRKVPVVVKALSYPYGDSTYVNLIYEYKKDGRLVLDTGSMNYESSAYQVGDTAKVYADDLGLGLDDETLKRMRDRQQGFYWVAGGVFFVALVFWMVSAVFKVRPPTTEGGRYSK
jgi:hypothetical protein